MRRSLSLGLRPAPRRARSRLLAGALGLGALLLAAGAAPAQEAGVEARVRGAPSGLLVRSGPGTGYGRIGARWNGDAVSVYEVRGEWVRIGPSQWVHSDYLRPVRASADGGAAAASGGVEMSADGKPRVRWVPANPGYQSRGRTREIDMVVLHTVEGSAAGAVNYMQGNSEGRRVSAHYVVGRDGSITQMVRDRDTAWHVRGYNSRSIGIEHGGYAARNQWTMAQYEASAAITRWVCDTYGIPKDREHIVPHSQLDPARRSDPGRYFDWELYMDLVRNGGSDAEPVGTHPGGGDAGADGRSHDALDVRPARPGPGQTIGLLHVRWREGDPASGYPGLKVEWLARGPAQTGARVFVEEVGGPLRWDSGHLAGAGTTHRIAARLKHDRTYRWRVRATDGEDVVTSDWVEFETDFTPPAITPVSPPEGAEVDSTPVLRWTYEDEDGGQQANYRVWLDDDADHSDVLEDTKQLNGPTTQHYVRSHLEPERTYYWRVAGMDGHGNIAISPWIAFTTSADFVDTAGRGPSVELLNPADGAAVAEDERAVLTWAYHPGASRRDQESVRIQVDDDEDPDEVPIDQAYDNPGARGFRVRRLEPGAYRWRVRVWNGQEAVWSGWRAFRVGEPEPEDEGEPDAAVEEPGADGLSDAVAATHGAEDENGPAEPAATADDPAPTALTESPAPPALPAADDADAAEAEALPASVAAGEDAAVTAGAPAPLDAPDAPDAPSVPEAAPPTADDPPWSRYHRGLEHAGATLPRRGLANPFVQKLLGLPNEPLGERTRLGEAEFVRGKVSWFGGPRASGRSGLTRERLSRLNNPLRAAASTRLGARADEYYYAAMRWNYREPGAGWYRTTARILVVHPANGRGVVLRVADWGPGASTGRILNASPQALRDLDAKTDDELLVAFARDDAPLGPVRE